MNMELECQGHNPPYRWHQIDTSTLREDDQESMGTKEKWWYRDANGNRWLFKEAREKSGHVRGEDWAECIVHSVAQLLGFPSACVALAVRDDRRGVLVRSVLTPDQMLIHGNELLQEEINVYDPSSRRSNPNYTLANIERVLQPFGSKRADWSAFDMFASYLTLDALTGARDRHHENWAVVAGTERSYLAPSFDHGNALGFTEPDRRIHELLHDESRMERWLENGKSHHIPDKPTLVNVAIEALDRVQPGVREEILNKVQTIDLKALRESVDQIPIQIMSDDQRSFILRIIDGNRRRLLHGYPSSI